MRMTPRAGGTYSKSNVSPILTICHASLGTRAASGRSAPSFAIGRHCTTSESDRLAKELSGRDVSHTVALGLNAARLMRRNLVGFPTGITIVSGFACPLTSNGKSGTLVRREAP